MLIWAVVIALISFACGFLAGAVWAAVGGGRPNPPSGGPVKVTLQAVDASKDYGPDDVERLIREIEKRSLDGRTLNIKVA